MPLKTFNEINEVAGMEDVNFEPESKFNFLSRQLLLQRFFCCTLRLYFWKLGGCGNDLECQHVVNQYLKNLKVVRNSAKFII